MRKREDKEIFFSQQLGKKTQQKTKTQNKKKNLKKERKVF